MRKTTALRRIAAIVVVGTMGAGMLAGTGGETTGFRSLPTEEAAATIGAQVCNSIRIQPAVVCDRVQSNCDDSFCQTCRTQCDTNSFEVIGVIQPNGNGYSTTVNCGQPGLGATYNVLACTLSCDCLGPVINTFFCNSQNATIFKSCAQR